MGGAPKRPSASTSHPALRSTRCRAAASPVKFAICAAGDEPEAHRRGKAGEFEQPCARDLLDHRGQRRQHENAGVLIPGRHEPVRGERGGQCASHDKAEEARPRGGDGASHPGVERISVTTSGAVSAWEAGRPARAANHRPTPSLAPAACRARQTTSRRAAGRRQADSKCLRAFVNLRKRLQALSASSGPKRRDPTTRPHA